MAISGKLEFEVEIKSPGNLFLEVFGTKKTYLPTICPHLIKSIQLLHGNLGLPGCTIIVHYLFDGKEVSSTEMVEVVDEENKSITYKLLEGDIMEMYKSMRITFQLVSKDEHNFLRWMYEYEKIEDNTPPPHHMQSFADEVTKIVDAHYLQNKN